MINEAAAWLIPGLPFASFVIIGLVIRPFFDRHSSWSGHLTVGSIAASLALSIWAFVSVANSDGNIPFGSHDWVAFAGLTIPYGILMDSLTVVMLIVVGGVSLLVQIYSQGYMKGDPSYSRFFAYMSLFTASMLGLVLSRGIIQLYVFWELVGLGSYLLIGFWFQRPAAAAAAKKAFLMTRLGDFGFLLAILYLFTQGSDLLDLPTLYGAVHAGFISVSVVTWIALGVFAGAVGKSAQFPLHSWLPDAMEGPTPVSALIHAATMVAAGVFLVGRFFPLFEMSTAALNIVALIGGFTAVFAATMGLVATDIKRVLAFSTISQLGYMFLALGLGAYVAAFFHLFMHAWFKALLFLGAGSASHASGTFDMRYMGGLRKVMPWTYVTMVIGGLSLAGIFPFAGFWSKDEILGGALEAGTPAGTAVYVLGLSAVFLTAFYMFRVIFMTFHGEFRGGAAKEIEDLRAVGREPDESLAHGGVHLAESPWIMVAPLVVLATAAIVAGVLTNPPGDIGVVEKHAFGGMVTESQEVFVDHDARVQAGAEPDFNWPTAIISSGLAVAGIGLAYAMYVARVLSPATLAGRFRPVYILLLRKYFIDELYEDLIVRRQFYRRFLRALEFVDESWIDNLNKRVGLWTGHAGRIVTQVQNGQLQTYGIALSIGIVVILAMYLISR